MLIIICQAHLLADPLTIPLMYNLVLWNNFLKKTKKKQENFIVEGGESQPWKTKSFTSPVIIKLIYNKAAFLGDEPWVSSGRVNPWEGVT